MSETKKKNSGSALLLYVKLNKKCLKFLLSLPIHLNIKKFPFYLILDQTKPELDKSENE